MENTSSRFNSFTGSADTSWLHILPEQVLLYEVLFFLFWEVEIRVGVGRCHLPTPIPKP